MRKSKENSNRVARVNSLIERVLGQILRKVLEEETGLVTITKVETTRDLKYTKVWLSVLHGDYSNIFRILQKHIYRIQGELNKYFTTKVIPRVSFHLDTTPGYVERIEEIIKKIHNDSDKS